METINLQEVPRDLIIATFNEVYPIVFGHEEFKQKSRVRAFIHVLDYNCEEKLKKKIELLQQRYNREFRKIISENEDVRTSERTSRLLLECNHNARKQFEWLQTLLSAHIKFYTKINSYIDEYNKNNKKIQLNHGLSGVIVAGNGMVVLTQGLSLERRPSVSILYDDKEDGEELIRFLNKVDDLSKVEEGSSCE